MTEQENQIIQYAAKNGKTKDETVAALARYREMNAKAQMMQSAQPEKGALADIPSDIAETAKGIKETIIQRGEKQRNILEAEARGEQGKLSTIFQTATNLASTVTEVVGKSIMGVGKLFTTPGQEERIKGVMTSTAQKVMAQPEVQQFIQNYKDLEKSNPEMARNLVATVEGGAFLLEFLGLKGTKVATEATIRGGKAATESIIQTGKQVLKTTAEAASELAGTVKKPVQGVFNVVKFAGEGLSQIPGRIGTNIAEKQAIEATIKTLPTQIAQNAARNGVSVADITSLSSLALTDTEKVLAKELVTTAKNFARGVSKVDPIEIVGKPITASLKELNNITKSVGKQIGEVANTLPKVATEELQPAIFDSLKQVPGLQGLKVNSKGILNFSDTVLQSAESLADRKAIQNIFEQAIKSGTGKQKHLLRQELFEVLGGKKGSLQALTETQDKAFEAVRKGLANVLDSKNNTYKALNESFAKTIQPLRNMRKILKITDMTDDQIANMSAGIFARRLTSTAPSRAQLTELLQSIDEALKASGKSAPSTKKLQDLYNIVSNYYDIAPSTGFQGQTKAAIESAGGISEAITKSAKGLIGETPAVRQKALDNLLDDILGIKKAEGAIPPTSSNPTSVKQLVANAKEYDSAFKKSVNDIGESGKWKVEHGPVKTEARINEKIDLGEKTLETSMDTNRSTIIVKDPAELANVESMTKNQFNKMVTKNKFNYPDGEYKSAIINVDTPYGHKAEIAVTTPEYWNARMNKGGDALYKQVRVKQGNWQEAEQEMKALYTQAQRELEARLSNSL